MFGTAVLGVVLGTAVFGVVLGTAVLGVVLGMAVLGVVLGTAVLGVVFGTCRSFFAPCGPRPLGGHGSCNHPTGGTGPCGPFNPCVYDSYGNH